MVSTTVGVVLDMGQRISIIPNDEERRSSCSNKRDDAGMLLLSKTRSSKSLKN